MPGPTKIPFIFVGDEADENTFLIFVGRPTKISGPTKFYAFPVVVGHLFSNAVNQEQDNTIVKD
jgi:hypothetical protein